MGDVVDLKRQLHTKDKLPHLSPQRAQFLKDPDSAVRQVLLSSLLALTALPGLGPS